MASLKAVALNGEEKNSISSMVASMLDSENKSINEFINEDGAHQEWRKNSGWSISLDDENKYRLNWSYNYGENLITFALNINNSSRTQTSTVFNLGTDLFALGFSDYGKSLASSDFCLIWYDLSYRLHLQDARTNSQNILQLIDKSQSVCKLLSNHDEEYLFEQKVKKSNHFRRHSSLNKNENGNENVEGEKNSFIKGNNNNFEIKFTRPLDVCDDNLSYYKIDNGTTHLVWFSLKGPLLNLDGLNLTQALASNSNTKSGQSGMNRVQLIASKPKLERKKVLKPNGNGNENGNNENVKSFSIKMQNFSIPARETTYWCKLFKLPKRFNRRKFHIIKYGPSIEKRNQHLVHHMELFNCVDENRIETNEKQLEALYKSGGWSGDCGNVKSRPKVTQTCKKVLMAWAMGAHPLQYPPLVGQSIGGPAFSPYVMLEVHYNNVKQSAGSIDSSGLKFYYTNKLRPYEAGILEVGLEYTDKYAIPPNLIVPLAGYCVSECTRIGLVSNNMNRFSGGGGGEVNGMITSDKRVHKFYKSNEEEQEEEDEYNNNNNNNNNDKEEERGSGKALFGLGKTNGIDLDNRELKLEEGIYVFAAQLHTHLTGISSWTEHIRGGKLVGELQRDNHYSPHFQEIRFLPEPVRIAPGDALIHYCLYDTTKRSNVTLGGEATSDEMCVTYMHYYPRVDLEVCKSSVDSEALEEYFRFLSAEEGQPTGGKLVELHGDSFMLSSANVVVNSTSNSNTNNENGSKLSLKTVSENYKSIRWTRKRSEELIQFYSNAPLSVQCNRSNGDRFPGSWNGIEATKILEDRKQSEPYNLKATIGRELVSYRGHGAGQRHALCERGA